jgi:MFS family permease
VRYLSFLETAALILSLFFVGVSFGGSTPLVSGLLETAGESEYFTGGVVAMLSLGLALASPWAGRLVDRFGPRPVNATGLMLQGAGIAGLGLALAVDVRLLFPMRFWLGISAALTFVAAEFALLNGTRPARRGRVMAAYGAAFGFGFMVGVFLGGRIFDRLGLASFLLLAGLAFGIAPAALWGMRGIEGARQKHGNPARSPKSLPWSALVLALYGAVVYAVLDVAMIGTYPVEGQRLGLSRAEALDVVGWMALGTILVQPAAGWLSDTFGSRRVLFTLAGVGFAASVVAGAASSGSLREDMLVAVVAFTVMGLAAGGIFPVSLAILGERTPPRLLSRANAAFSQIFGYASLLAPVIGASFIDAAERFGLLGWAVPSLALLTFGAAVPLGILERGASNAEVVENDDALVVAAQPESDRG